MRILLFGIDIGTSAYKVAAFLSRWEPGRHRGCRIFSLLSPGGLGGAKSPGMVGGSMYGDQKATGKQCNFPIGNYSSGYRRAKLGGHSCDSGGEGAVQYTHLDGHPRPKYL